MEARAKWKSDVKYYKKHPDKLTDEIQRDIDEQEVHVKHLKDKAMIKYDEYQEKLPPEPDLSEYFEWLEFLDKSIKNAERQIVDKARDNGKLLFSLWS